MEEGTILLWKIFLRVARTEILRWSSPTKYPELLRLLQAFRDSRSTVRHTRPASTDRESYAVTVSCKI